MVSFNTILLITIGSTIIILAYVLSPILLRRYTIDKDGNILPPGPAMRYALLGKTRSDLAMEFMDLTGPWSNAIDFLEPLQWIPTRTRARGHKLHDGLIEVYGNMIRRVKARMDSGENVPDCLVKTLIETQEEEKLDWEDLCMLSAVFTLGGVHSVDIWDYSMVPCAHPSHPEVQARAHEELVELLAVTVGRPEDEPNLPYIRAIIKEVQRVHAPFWMATPHCTSQDFAYRGMYIPKDTVVVLNCYTLHHNEERYPDASVFNPDRYLGDDLSCVESAKLANVMERDHWTFGAGRRICPGLPVAERELWLAISRLLWSFTFHALPEEPISLEDTRDSPVALPCLSN
ncbi:hypothetical protein Hypma_008235 [Hypsizygus marmoreus]|uniref:Cytochrome P450 n=1 Tax=Hypsizygus marmoreus TaxID=39966 RepID=A0A369JZ06_HYPMA|nr:hypothetical protein Hypma_008235 [Hypsizygus marmoreus]